MGGENKERNNESETDSVIYIYKQRTWNLQTALQSNFNYLKILQLYNSGYYNGLFYDNITVLIIDIKMSMLKSISNWNLSKIVFCSYVIFAEQVDLIHPRKHPFF